MKNFERAKRHIKVSPGESLRILRELQEFSQNDLAARVIGRIFAGRQISALGSA